jgi:hypothetical protein
VDVARVVTYYTVFVMDLASRRVHIVGSTPYPNDLFMHQVSRMLTAADAGLLRHHRLLICDRDRKWSQDVQRILSDSGIRVVLTPVRAPNAKRHRRPRASTITSRRAA